MGEDAVSTVVHFHVVVLLDGCSTHFRHTCLQLGEGESRHGQHGAEHRQEVSHSALGCRVELKLNPTLLKEE